MILCTQNKVYVDIISNNYYLKLSRYIISNEASVKNFVSGFAGVISGAATSYKNSMSFSWGDADGRCSRLPRRGIEGATIPVPCQLRLVTLHLET